MAKGFSRCCDEGREGVGTDDGPLRSSCASLNSNLGKGRNERTQWGRRDVFVVSPVPSRTSHPSPRHLVRLPRSRSRRLWTYKKRKWVGKDLMGVTTPRVMECSE